MLGGGNLMGYIGTYILILMERFSKLPNNLSSVYYRYYVLTNYIYLLAFFAHAGLLLSFAFLGVKELAIFNIGSCSLFLIAIIINMRGYLVSSISLATFEVIAHAVAGVYILGLASGFQYYILGLLVTIFASPLRKLAPKIVLALLTSIIYILLNYYAQISTPIRSLDLLAINVYNVMNLLTCIFVVSLSIFASDSAALKAEQKLTKALEDLKEANLETEKKNEQLAKTNQQLEKKNEELASKNEELMQSYKRANLIFSALSEALPGTVLDEKYQLDKIIGRGAFGAVFKATHLTTKREVAAKVFQPVSGNVTAEGLERFQLEAILASLVNHHNAIEVLDSGISGGIAYIIMELLNGHSLTDELKKKNGRLSPKRCAEILVPICDVLTKAHSAGIVHRDIKPDNIFLHYCEEGEVIKVVDFGIAKLQNEIQGVALQNLTLAGGLVGTPIYMSPERLLHNICEAPSDVYSLGIMLYQMLSGKVPFYSTEIWQIIQMHINDTPVSLREVNPDILPKVEKIVFQALRKDPNERPSAMSLGQDFAASLGLEIKSTARGHTKIFVSGTDIRGAVSTDDPTLG